MTLGIDVSRLFTDMIMVNQLNFIETVEGSVVTLYEAIDDHVMSYIIRHLQTDEGSCVFL